MTPRSFAATESPVHVGRAKLVVKDVRSQLRNQPPKRVTVNEELFFNQRIITTKDSRGVVEFRDGSILQVGPNATVILDRFVFNPFESKSEKVLTAVAGAFRYISGMKTKSSMLEIRTPSATIGIRGSEAGFLVFPGIPTFVSLSHGIATVRNDRGAVQLTPGQSMAVPARTASLPQPSQIPPAVAVQALRYISSQVGAPPKPGDLQPATPQQAAADAAANALPSDQQAGPPTALPGLAGAAQGGNNVPPPPGVGLLVQAARVGLLEARGNAPLTPAQQNFVNAANAAIPDAAQVIQNDVKSAQQETRSNGNRSIQNIISSSVKNDPNAAKITELVTAAAAADDGGAAAIAEAALSAAPGQAVLIAAASVSGAPNAAASIARALSQARPELAAAITAVAVQKDQKNAANIVAAVAQVVPAKAAAEAVAAAANIVPGQTASLVSSVAAVSPNAAAQALSAITTAAGQDGNNGSNNGDKGDKGNGNNNDNNNDHGNYHDNHDNHDNDSPHNPRTTS